MGRFDFLDTVERRQAMSSRSQALHVQALSVERARNVLVAAVLELKGGFAGNPPEALDGVRHGTVAIHEIAARKGLFRHVKNDNHDYQACQAKSA